MPEAPTLSVAAPCFRNVSPLPSSQLIADITPKHVVEPPGLRAQTQIRLSRRLQSHNLVAFAILLPAIKISSISLGLPSYIHAYRERTDDLLEQGASRSFRIRSYGAHFSGKLVAEVDYRVVSAQHSRNGVWIFSSELTAHSRSVQQMLTRSHPVCVLANVNSHPHGSEDIELIGGDEARIACSAKTCPRKWESGDGRGKSHESERCGPHNRRDVEMR